jgi:hypothetical protein
LIIGKEELSVTLYYLLHLFTTMNGTKQKYSVILFIAIGIPSLLILTASFEEVVISKENLFYSCFSTSVANNCTFPLLTAF